MGWNGAVRASIGTIGILLAAVGTAHAQAAPTTPKVNLPSITAATSAARSAAANAANAARSAASSAANAVRAAVSKPTVPIKPNVPTLLTTSKPAPNPLPAPKIVPKITMPVTTSATNPAAATTKSTTVSTPQPVPAASPTYTFAPTAYGTVQVSKNGTIIATTTPQLATQQYGYQLSGVSTPASSVSAPAAPITSGNVTTPSGAVVNAATGQLVSSPPASTSPPAQTSAPLVSASTPPTTNTTPTPGATPAYTFSPTASNTIQVFQNGKLISTTTPQLAAQYGYQVPKASAQPAISITAPTSNVSTNVGRTVTAIATQPASVQLAALPVSSTAKAALNTVASNPAISAKNATSSGGYIYPPGTSGSTKSTGLSQQQCAVLVEALRPDVPQSTGKWAPVGATAANLKGQTIQDANLSAGTPIATFMSNGKYPVGTQLMDTAPFHAGAPKEPHSGIFVGYLKDAGGNIIRDAGGKPIGFEMLAQSARVPATIEKRLFEPVPSSSPYSNIQVENYQYSAISTSSSTSASSR